MATTIHYVVRTILRRLSIRLPIENGLSPGYCCRRCETDAFALVKNIRCRECHLAQLRSSLTTVGPRGLLTPRNPFREPSNRLRVAVAVELLPFFFSTPPNTVGFSYSTDQIFSSYCRYCTTHLSDIIRLDGFYRFVRLESGASSRRRLVTVFSFVRKFSNYVCILPVSLICRVVVVNWTIRPLPVDPQIVVTLPCTRDRNILLFSFPLTYTFSLDKFAKGTITTTNKIRTTAFC